mgnify:CR=1 FL=1
MVLGNEISGVWFRGTIAGQKAQRFLSDERVIEWNGVPAHKIRIHLAFDALAGVRDGPIMVARHGRVFRFVCEIRNVENELIAEGCFNTKVKEAFPEIAFLPRWYMVGDTGPNTMAVEELVSAAMVGAWKSRNNDSWVFQVLRQRVAKPTVDDLVEAAGIAACSWVDGLDILLAQDSIVQTLEKRRPRVIEAFRDDLIKVGFEWN